MSEEICKDGVMSTVESLKTHPEPLMIKVCGMRSPHNILEVASLRPDYMGLIFYPKSPRFCGEAAPLALQAMPCTVNPVMVTVNMDIHLIRDLADRYGIRTLQLHGDEPPEYCQTLKECGKIVWKAVGVSDADSLECASRYAGVADMMVLDTASKLRGGAGRKFDWNVLLEWKHPVDYILSGGIGEDDAEVVLRLKKSQTHLRGIDLNSRFELSPGIKDVSSLSRFIETIRKAEK